MSIQKSKPDNFLIKSDKEKKKDFNELVAKNMGTTANILFIKNNYIYLANVGDSMAVIFINGEAIKLNHEHKVTLLSESTRISKSGAKIINNRIEGRLNLTRAIGKNYIFNIFLTLDLKNVYYYFEFKIDKNFKSLKYSILIL